MPQPHEGAKVTQSSPRQPPCEPLLREPHIQVPQTSLSPWHSPVPALPLQLHPGDGSTPQEQESVRSQKET